MPVRAIRAALILTFAIALGCTAAPPPPASTAAPAGPPSGLAAGRVLYSLGGLDLWSSKPDGSDRQRVTVDGAAAGYAGGRWSPNGRMLAAERYPVSEAGTALYLIHPGAPPARLTKPDTFLDGYAWSPDGRYLAYGVVLSGITAAAGGMTAVGAVGDVHLYDTRTEKDAVIGPGTHPAFSADGRRLGYAHLSGAIGLVDLSPLGQGASPADLPTQMLVTLADLSRVSTAIAPRGMGLIGGPQFSADGKYVAYAAIENGPVLEAEQIVFIQDAVAGAPPRRVPLGKTGALHHVADLRWSPAAPLLAYTIINAQPHHHWLAVIDARTGQSRELYDSQNHFLDYSWAPDGGAILLQVDDGDLWLYFSPDRPGPTGMVRPGGWRPEWCGCAP